MSALFSSPPTPPSPIATAGAQTASNVSTAVANAFLNNTNQVTPTGNLNYDQTSTYSFNDLLNGVTYNIPRFTATQTLSPNEQAIQTQGEGAKLNMAQLANSQSARLGNLLSNDITSPTHRRPVTRAPSVTFRRRRRRSAITPTITRLARTSRTRCFSGCSRRPRAR
jgi:hypothetical protein